MDDALNYLYASDIASALRQSRWGYAAVNATHILGLALLVGAIVPLDLRLIGFWRTQNRETLIRVLVPTAAAGLLMAVCSGLLLFAVRAPEYARNPVLFVKLTIVALGALSALYHHARHGASLATASAGELRRAGLISLACWVPALFLGRLIAFTGE